VPPTGKNMGYGMPRIGQSIPKVIPKKIRGVEGENHCTNSYFRRVKLLSVCKKNIHRPEQSAKNFEGILTKIGVFVLVKSLKFWPFLN
jgi:hypothetical protein